MIHSNSYKEYKLYYWDIEILKDFMTLTYLHWNTDKKKVEYMILHKDNLESQIVKLKDLLSSPNSIWIAWNVGFDKSVILNLFHFWDNYEVITDKKFLTVKKANEDKSKSEIILMYLKQFSDAIINKTSYYEFLYEEIEDAEIKRGAFVDYTYSYLSHWKRWVSGVDGKTFPIFYDAAKEQLVPISLKAYQANTGMNIYEFVLDDNKDVWNITYEDAIKDNKKILIALLKYNLNDTVALAKLHSKNLETLQAKFTLLTMNNLSIDKIEKKPGALLNFIFTYKENKTGEQHKYSEFLPINQEQNWYDFMIYNNASTTTIDDVNFKLEGSKIVNVKLKKMLDEIRENVINKDNPYYQVITEFFNAKFALITIPTLEEWKNEEMWKNLGNDNKKISISKSQRSWYKNYAGTSFYYPDIDIKYHIPVNYNNTQMLLSGDIKNGGIHSAIKNSDFKNVSLKDIDSQYPSIMIVFNLLSRNFQDSSVEQYKQMKQNRIEFKRLAKIEPGEKGQHYNEMSNALKTPLNTKYGTMKAPYYNAFDPDNANRVCYTGEMMLLFLSYLLWEVGVHTLQHNTDGIVTTQDNDKVPGVMEKFANISQMSFTNNTYDIFIQKDVNNYIAYSKDHDEWHNKGAFIKNATLSAKDLTKANFVLTYPILGIMVVNKIVFNKDYQTSIAQNPQLINYLKLVRTNERNPKIAIYDGQQYIDQPYKVFRLLATTDGHKHYFHKGNSYNSISYTSEKMTNVLEDITDKTINDYNVDFDFYYQMADEIYLNFMGQKLKTTSKKKKLPETFNIFELAEKFNNS